MITINIIFKRKKKWMPVQYIPWYFTCVKEKRLGGKVLLMFNNSTIQSKTQHVKWQKRAKTLKHQIFTIATKPYQWGCNWYDFFS